MNNEYLEILVEEKSMEKFLEGILPKILPTGIVLNENCFIRTHNGKQHLQKSIPTIMKAYKSYPLPVRVLVMQDQDSSDCRVLKNRLIKLIEENSSGVKYMVRIACRELENWYLGDLNAIEKVYPKSKASKFMHKSKFRNPDLLNGAEEMMKMSEEFAKVNCARSIAQVISTTHNNSPSFQHFCSGLQKISK